MNRCSLLSALLLVSAACAQHPKTEPPSPPADTDPVDDLVECAKKTRMALFDRLLAFQTDDLGRLVEAENRLSEKAREELLVLSEQCAAKARAVIEEHPDRVEGHIFLAANLGLVALTKGNAAALLEGLPGKVRSAYERALEIDRTYDAAAALRIKGKFQLGAPWPIGSRKEAGESLEQAVEIAPIPENLLWLGDFYFLERRREEAIEAWRAAIETETRGAVWLLDSRARELARRRLDLAEGR